MALVCHIAVAERSASWLEDRGIELVRGHVRLEGERRVRVGEQLLIAREAVVVAVGSGAAQPPIPGLAEVPIATLAHAVAPFPTRSELWLKFLEAYESERLTLSAGPRPLAAAA